MAARVTDAVLGFEAGALDLPAYLTKLLTTLDKLQAFDRQVAAKIRKGQIVEPAASRIEELSAEIWALIDLLAANL